MKALTIRQPYPYAICLGKNAKDDHIPRRGDWLLCASKPGTDLYRIACPTLSTATPFAPLTLTASLMLPMEVLFWYLRNAHLLEPFPVKGRAHIFYLNRPITAIATNNPPTPWGRPASSSPYKEIWTLVKGHTQDGQATVSNTCLTCRHQVKKKARLLRAGPISPSPQSVKSGKRISSRLSRSP